MLFIASSDQCVQALNLYEFVMKCKKYRKHYHQHVRDDVRAYLPDRESNSGLPVINITRHK